MTSILRRLRLSPFSLHSHPNRRASVRVSVSHPQLGYATNGNGNGAGGIGGAGSTAATTSCTNAVGHTSTSASVSSSRISIATIHSHHGTGTGTATGAGAGGGDCNHPLEQAETTTTTPGQTANEERRHAKLRPFKIALNRVATPTLNLR